MRRQKPLKHPAYYIACLLVFLLVGLWFLTSETYEERFSTRLEPYAPLAFRVEDFDGLERTLFRFPADKGHMLTGCMYSAGTGQKGIVVIAHGLGGGGHNSMMDVAAYFARNGYYVFAYDATGNGRSEGKGIGGIPQGVIDLEYAISFVENSGNFPSLPVVLFGHSWGGYCVCSVLSFHPEVRAVIECSGCNTSYDLFKAAGKKEGGAFIYAMMPFIRLHEKIHFGKYADASALDGFAASKAAVMVVYSADDDVVPIETGYDLFYEKYGSDPRFTFVRFENRGHNYVYDDHTYINEFNAEYDEWFKALDYDHAENPDRFAADRAEFFSAHLDREKWSTRLDPELFARFLSFYDAHIGP